MRALQFLLLGFCLLFSNIVSADPTYAYVQEPVQDFEAWLESDKIQTKLQRIGNTLEDAVTDFRSAFSLQNQVDSVPTLPDLIKNLLNQFAKSNKLNSERRQVYEEEDAIEDVSFEEKITKALVIYIPPFPTVQQLETGELEVGGKVLVLTAILAFANDINRNLDMDDRFNLPFFLLHPEFDEVSPAGARVTYNNRVLIGLYNILGEIVGYLTEIREDLQQSVLSMRTVVQGGLWNFEERRLVGEASGRVLRRLTELEEGFLLAAMALEELKLKDTESDASIITTERDPWLTESKRRRAKKLEELEQLPWKGGQLYGAAPGPGP